MLVTLSFNFAGAHLYTRVVRGNARVVPCPITKPRPRLEPGLLDLKAIKLSIRELRPAPVVKKEQL